MLPSLCEIKMYITEWHRCGIAVKISSTFSSLHLQRRYAVVNYKCSNQVYATYECSVTFATFLQQPGKKQCSLGHPSLQHLFVSAVSGRSLNLHVAILLESTALSLGSACKLPQVCFLSFQIPIQFTLLEM